MGPDLHWFPEDVPLSRLAATLVGMANTAGGMVILGISPRSGQVQGVRDPEKAIDRVFQAALIPDPPLVLPIPLIQTIAGTTQIKVLKVFIPAGLPYVYSLDGSYLGREGNLTGPLSARRLRQLLMDRGAIQFETEVPPNASTDDLDPLQIEAYRDALKLPKPVDSKELLIRRGCLTMKDGQHRPTYACLLLFGRHPQQWLPNASILAARFFGEMLSDRFIKNEITGTLPSQLRQVESFIYEHLRNVVRLIGFTHQETLEYPLEAVRELCVNAVAHRDYNIQGDNIHINIFSDRLEVTSPGHLPGPITLDNLLEARFSRNAVIVQVLSDLGFVERLGYGLDRVVSLMRQHILPPPRFEEVAGNFRVTLFGYLENPEEAQRVAAILSAYQFDELNPRQQLAVSYLATHRRITNSAFQLLCPDVHTETLRRDLSDMVSRGVLIKIGEKRATYYILK